MSDTIKLLQECNAGIKMGIDAIDKVLSHVRDDEFKDKLGNYKKDYNYLQDEIDAYLKEFDVEGKNPDIFIKGMATIKTEIKIALNDTDATIADIMTDGCHMGVKGLNRYLNEYTQATDRAKELTKKLIRLMDRQEFDLRKYL